MQATYSPRPAQLAAYAIANVPAGPQIIRQVLPMGDTQTTPSGGNGIPVTVPAGGRSLMRISSMPSRLRAASVARQGPAATPAFPTSHLLDANNNGLLDAGELSTTTGPSGAYSFSNVPAGALIVRQILPAGDTQTDPANGYGIHIAVTSGGSLVNQNFIDAVPQTSNKGSVSGFAKTSAGKGIAAITIYLDTNNNGKLDSGEFSTTTDSTGAYGLSGVPAGALIIRQILPSGDKQTTPAGSLGIHITIKAGGSLTNQSFTDTVGQ